MKVIFVPAIEEAFVGGGGGGISAFYGICLTILFQKS